MVEERKKSQDGGVCLKSQHLEVDYTASSRPTCNIQYCLKIMILIIVMKALALWSGKIVFGNSQ